MRRGDWIPVFALAALLAATVGLSVEALADPSRGDEPASTGAMPRHEVEAVLDDAFTTSLNDAAGHPAATTRTATLRSRT